jgi:hypothetical protein
MIQSTNAAATPLAPTASIPQIPEALERGTKVARIDLNNRPDAPLKVYDVLGDASGYASLDAAVNAATQLSSGNAPSVAVILNDGRYFNQLAVRMPGRFDNKPGRIVSTPVGAAPAPDYELKYGRPYTMGTEHERGVVFTNPALKLLIDGPVKLQAS